MYRWVFTEAFTFSRAPFLVPFSVTHVPGLTCHLCDRSVPNTAPLTPPSPPQKVIFGGRGEFKALLGNRHQSLLDGQHTASTEITSPRDSRIYVQRRDPCASAASQASTERGIGWGNSSCPTGSFRFPSQYKNTGNVSPGEDRFTELLTPDKISELLHLTADRLTSAADRRSIRLWKPN